MTKKRNLNSILIAVIIILCVYIWTQYQKDNTQQPPPPSQNKVEQNLPDKETNNNQVLTDKEKTGGTYTEAISAPPHLDPNRSPSEELTDISVNIYESLYELDINNHPVPALATSCQTSEGGKKYTFTLRKGVKFHDGSDMTAQDVLASFEYWLKYGNSADIRNKIVGYGISEKNNLFYVELKEVYAPFVGRLSNYVDNQRLVIMPKEVAVTGNDKTMIEIPCGTGPYKFTEWIPGQYCKLTRFDDYTPFNEVPASGASGKKTAYFDQVVFKFIDDADTRLSSVKSGNVDYAGKITSDEYELLSDDSSVHVILGPLKEQNMFIFNCGIAPFNNVKARLAVMTGIDIDEIAKVAVSSNTDYWADEASLFGSSSIWADPEAGEDVYNIHDLDQAHSYLEESDYNGDPVMLVVDSKDTTQFLATQILQNQLEEIGFTTKLVSLDKASLENIIAAPEGWNIYTTTFHTTYYDPLAYATLINKDAWISHWSGSDAEAMNQIYAKLAQVTDAEQRQKIIKEWNDMFYETAPAIKSFSFKSAYLFNPNIEASWLNQLGIIPDGIAYNAWLKKAAVTTTTTTGTSTDNTSTDATTTTDN